MTKRPSGHATHVGSCCVSVSIPAQLCQGQSDRCRLTAAPAVFGGVCRKQLGFKQTATGQDCPLAVCYPCMYNSADMRRMNFPRRARAGCVTQQQQRVSAERWQMATANPDPTLRHAAPELPRARPWGTRWGVLLKGGVSCFGGPCHTQLKGSHFCTFTLPA